MIQLLLILIINSFVLIAWGKYLHHLDAFTADKKNEHKLFWFIVTGIILNTILVSIMYPLWENILFSMTGLVYGRNPFISNFIIVGPVEEITKFLIFITLAGMFKSIKEPRDGILQAASVALGFALMENFFYAMDYGFGLLLVRSIISIIGHVTYAALWGFAWSSAVYTSNKNSKSRDWYYVLPFIMVASMFHGAFNTFLDYGLVFFAILIKLITLVLFIIIYRYVRDNSPYKSYSLKEYKRAIQSLTLGLNKYPKSYELNKRMGIFQIYVRKYHLAEKFLRIAHKLKPGSPFGKFYYGLARYLNGNNTDGIKMMNTAVGELPSSVRKKHVLILNKLIRDESVRKKLITQFNYNNLQFESSLSYPKNRKNNRLTSEQYRLNRGKSWSQPKRYSSNYSYSNSKRKKSDWERLIKINPDPVILKPYTINRSSVVNRAGESYNAILDKKVAELKKLVRK